MNFSSFEKMSKMEKGPNVAKMRKMAKYWPNIAKIVKLQK
jgi:hypothetical protein